MCLDYVTKVPASSFRLARPQFPGEQRGSGAETGERGGGAAVRNVPAEQSPDDVPAEDRNAYTPPAEQSQQFVPNLSNLDKEHDRCLSLCADLSS